MDENRKLIAFNDEIIKSYKTCDILRIHEKDINSIDFSNDGNLILTSGKDHLLSIYDIERRAINRKLYNKTYGCENAIFTHNPKAVLCSSHIDCKHINI